MDITNNAVTKGNGLIPFLTFGILLTSCGSNSDESSNADIITVENIPPVVSITPIKSSLRQGRSHTLTAQANDSDGYISQIQWQQISGPTLEISRKNSLQISFIVPEADNKEASEYRFRITVSDNKSTTANAEISFSSHFGMNPSEAAHLLHQATLGPTYYDIDSSINLIEEEWINKQISKEYDLHLSLIKNLPEKNITHYTSWINAWWHAALYAPDQLRKRITFALSQIFVVSDIGFDTLFLNPEGMANYYDILGKNAFGNFRDLLSDISRSPVMGNYLSHLGNKKENNNLNIRPDENFARELMQLFTIGLIKLNQDGTPILNSNGLTLPTYGQDEIENFARVFTGWNYANATYWKWPHNFIDPMEPWEEFHDKDEKKLLNGTVLPAGQTARQDLEQALDNLFYHPNVPPFISKQLIKRLVTSNPTPQYVKRVADVFTDNGEGIRGDLAAVIKAILLDNEARHFSGVLQYSGKIREPLLRTVQFWRELDAKNKQHWFYIPTKTTHGQAPLGAPSVFNFFRPDYQPVELQVQHQSAKFPIYLTAPELQIANDSSLIGLFNHHFFYHIWRIKETITTFNKNTILLTLQPHVDRLNDQGLDALLDHYNILFFSGRMSAAMRQTLVNTHNIFANWSDYEKVGYLLFTISVSPEYVLQH